jgi:hypothetical protein
LPDPARGGSHGYPVPDRHYQMARAAAGLDVKASASSIWRSTRRDLPFQMTGNKQRESIVGMDQFLMATAITIWPDLTLDEITIFIYLDIEGCPRPCQWSRSNTRFDRMQQLMMTMIIQLSQKQNNVDNRLGRLLLGNSTACSSTIRTSLFAG